MPLWTAPQRRIVWIFGAILVVALGVRLWHDSMRLPRDPHNGLRAGEIADRLDPNVAELWQLQAVPQLGGLRAQDIVAYRKQMARDQPWRRPFESLDDLAKVHGIGRGVLNQVRPYLLVPATAPAD